MMICLPIMAKNTEAALEKMAAANGLADMFELRLDAMESWRLGDILQAASKPLIVTCRSEAEGGKGTLDDDTRTGYLLDAVDRGADFVDVEFSMPASFQRRLLQTGRSHKVILSTHLVTGTPSRDTLVETFQKMALTGADVVKIVTKATSIEDNLRVLDLIPMAQVLGVRIITFCMGPKGRLSRVASPLLGGYLTFASLEEGEESADGQIPLRTMRKILGILAA